MIRARVWGMDTDHHSEQSGEGESQYCYKMGCFFKLGLPPYPHTTMHRTPYMSHERGVVRFVKYRDYRCSCDFKKKMS